MTELRALIFDVDGTLAETERDGHRVAFNRAFAEAGLDWEWSVERYGHLLGTAGGKERLQRYLQEDHPEFVPVPDATTWAATLHKAKTRHYKTLVQEGIMPLRLGVKRLIQEAREQGVKLAIATTSAPENVVALLETNLAADSPNWFEVIAAGDMVPAKKPAPDVYLYALAELGVPPAACLAIEDSRQGLLAATQAGLKTVVTRSHYTQEEDFREAVLVLDHLGEPEAPLPAIAGHPICSTYFDLALAAELVNLPHPFPPPAPHPSFLS
ncbi:MAG: HAD family hydrolase [Leptolyngbyaceae cyanobacterium bins.349]|nr:HAD family hydrolase [Leptolyngbyaceae cyanobacterium bins.349]